MLGVVELLLVVLVERVLTSKEVEVKCKRGMRAVNGLSHAASV